MNAAPGPDVDDLDGGARRAAVLAASFIIVARDEDGVIGDGRRIPWRQHADMRHFRNATLGCALIVGRTTFDTLPTAMPGRDVIVVTRTPLTEGATAIAVPSVDAAVEAAISDTGARAVAFAGGPRIYAAALQLPWMRRTLVTEIAGRHGGDVRMPPLEGEWIETDAIDLPVRAGEPAARVRTLVR